MIDKIYYIKTFNMVFLNIRIYDISQCHLGLTKDKKKNILSQKLSCTKCVGHWMLKT